MTDTIRSLAEQFVTLVIKYKWREVSELPADEVKLIFDVVVAAGFNPKEIRLGRLFPRDRAADGKMYPINSLCPYKFIGQDGKDYYHPTGWINQILRILEYKYNIYHEDLSKLIDFVEREIKRSIPLEPIELTQEGDYLEESFACPSIGYCVDHKRDCDRFNSFVGIHRHCGGSIERRGATDTHDVIVCQSCFWRMRIPKEIGTFGELREFMFYQLNHPSS